MYNLIKYIMTNFDYSKIPIGYYDIVLKKGLAKKRGLQSCWHHTKFLNVKNSMGNYSSHLDIACGPGTFIGNYLDNKSYGVDISRQQINYAKFEYSEFKENFICDDVTNSKIEFKKYDVITLLEFIEHIQPLEVDNLLNTLYDMLNKNGKLIITTPNYFGLWPILEKFVSIFGPVDYKYQHINKYTENRIKKEFNFSDIKIKKFINFGIFLSFLNHNLAIKFEQFISNLFKGYFGYSLLIIINKN